VKKCTYRAGFSLTETVIALGLFGFCILPILALLPVGIASARSVTEESAAAALAEAYFGALQVAPDGANKFEIPGIFDNPPVDIPTGASGQGTMYFRGDGTQVAGAEEATLRMDYALTRDPVQDTITANLSFRWPPSASTNRSTQVRYFTQIIPR